MPTIRISDFSGGLNLRDSALELAPNETPDALNWTLDTRGAAKQRKGCLNAVALPGVSGKAAYPWFSTALGQWFCVRETIGAPNTLHFYTRPADLSGSWTDRGQIALGQHVTWQIGFVDWPGSTYSIISAANFVRSVGEIPPGTPTERYIYTWDGTTFTQRSATNPGGSCLAVIGNRAWACGGMNATLYYSATGDGTNWTTADSGNVGIMAKDGETLASMALVGNALLLFKSSSAYRVNDFTTGGYSVLDSNAGAIGPRAVAVSRGRAYSWGADSLYEWDGIGPGKRIGDKLLPLFATDPAITPGVPALAAGTLQDRLLFAYPSSAGGNNDRLLEYDAEHKWLMKHRLASTAKDEVSSFARKGADTYAAIRDGDIMFKVFSETAGADDGTLFASNNFRTRWIQPYDGKLCRISKAQVEGLTVTGGTTTLKFRVYKDWNTSAFAEFDISADLRGGSAGVQVAKSIVQSLGHARAFAFEFVAGTAAGAAEIDALTLDWIPLE